MRKIQILQNSTQEKVNGFRYLLTVFNSEGWADAKKHLPIPFDLVTIETKTGKKVSAWWTQVNWDGLYLKPSDSVVKWKRRRYEQIN